MNVIEAVSTRRSVRNYTDELIDRDTLEELIRLGTMAATAGNMQLWGFVVIQGKDVIAGYEEPVKADLLARTDEYPNPERYRRALGNPDYNIFHNAANMILIYGKSEYPFYVHDCTLAAANIMLAGHEMGIGSCWIGFAHYYFNSPDFKASQSVPKEYDLVSVMTLGYPAKPVIRGPIRKKPRIFSWI